MRVLFVTRGYPTIKYPKNGIFEFDQAKAIASLGYEVIFASLDMRSIRRWRKWGFERFEREGVLVCAVNYPIGGVPKKLLSYFYTKALRKLYLRIEKLLGKPDIIHAHFTMIGHAAARLKEYTGIPLVLTEHSSHINKDTIDPDLYKAAKHTYEKSDALIAVSPSYAEFLGEKFVVNATYIPNMVDLGVFQYKEKLEDNKFKFVSVASLDENKNMDITIRAFQRAFKNNSSVNLVIFGEGAERKNLEKLISELNLSSRVKLMGQQPREKISESLAQADCFVLASRAETFGLAFVEAMAMGVPVIASRSGGPEAFVNSDNGILVNVDDLEQLVEAMKHMYEKTDQYSRAKIAETSIEKFSPDVVASQIVEVYKTLLAQV